MTRKRWRKLMQSKLCHSGKILNDLRHAKAVRGHDGQLYWANTWRVFPADSYDEIYRIYNMYN